MSNWDQDYNESDLTPYQVAEMQTREMERRRLLREARDSHMTVPTKNREELLEQFGYHHTLPVDSYMWDGYSDTLDAWGANKIWQVCHHCGWIQYKNTPRETNKCGRCRSRACAMLTAADISQAILFCQNVTHNILGVNMNQVFEQRKERLKSNRKAAKDAME